MNNFKIQKLTPVMGVEIIALDPVATEPQDRHGRGY